MMVVFRFKYVTKYMSKRGSCLIALRLLHTEVRLALVTCTHSTKRSYRDGRIWVLNFSEAPLDNF